MIWTILRNAAMQICVLDEPSNFLDREALGGLAVAIKEWAGAVVRASQQLNSCACAAADMHHAR